MALLLGLNACTGDEFVFPAKTKGSDKWGFYNSKGKTIAEPQFRMATGFSCGLARIDHNGKIGYINKSGKYVIEPQYADGTVFSDNRAFVVRSGSNIECIDNKGRVLYSLNNITYVENTSGPFATVSDGRKKGVIDKNNGHYIFECSWDDIHYSPSVDLFKYELQQNDELFGWMSIKGDIIFKAPPFKYPSNGVYISNLPGEGLCPFLGMNGKYGYLNSQDEVAIPFQFNKANTFKNGLAIVNIYGKYGAIDKYGEFQIKPSFDEFYSFNDNGIAVVRKDSFYGYINENGRFVINPIFSDARSIKDGIGIAALDGHYGVINDRGDFIIEPIFDDIKSYDKGFGIVRSGQLWGVINSSGRYVIEPRFTEIGGSWEKSFVEKL